MFRRPGTGRSKASPDTLCQKCLKRGHYSYECKAPAQERPYKPRPSRTQQLLNPTLKPKLTTEVPNELLRKKGVADEILKNKETERKRSRSLSTSSVDSVSTISTNRSPSRSRSPRRRKQDETSLKVGNDRATHKRSRRSVTMDSRSSNDSHDADRNTRRRMSSFSPGERGRRRSRSRSRSKRQVSRSRSPSANRHRKRPMRLLPLSRSLSRSPDRMDTSDDRNPHTTAPRGRWGSSPQVRRAPSRSPPPYRGNSDRSPSPYSKRKAARRSLSPQQARNGDRGYGGPREPGRNRFDDGPVPPNGRAAPLPPVQAPPVQRDRSLSPYSKRVALTRQMHVG